MLNNGERFRCHFSMIFERTITLFILFVFWIFQSFLDEDSINDTMKMIKQLKSGNIRDNDDFFGAIVGLGIVLIVSIIIFVFNWISWAKTYISVVDNTLIWEKNTINKKKKTIAVQNISNINTITPTASQVKAYRSSNAFFLIMLIITNSAKIMTTAIII